MTVTPPRLTLEKSGRSLQELPRKHAAMDQPFAGIVIEDALLSYAWMATTPIHR
jgi:hypothetical protein